VTEKKTKRKKAVANVVEDQDGVALTSIPHPGSDNGGDEVDLGDINPDALETVEVEIEIPERGPDYHVTAAGDILLDAGCPIPEDHPVHPAHRALAAARKASQ
jgi:hypothetical protein